MESSTIFKSLPKHPKEILKDQDLLVSLLQAEGLTDIKSVTLGQKVAGTTHHVQKATLDCGDSKIEVVIKYNHGGQDECVEACPWREAYFYSKIAQTVPGLKVPKLYLALGDEAKGQYLLITECCKDGLNLMEIYMAVFMATDISEAVGPAATLDNCFIKVAESLATLHSHTYVADLSSPDLSSQKLKSGHWIQGQGKESFEKAAESVVKICTASLEKGEGLNPNESEIPALMKASMDKISFDAVKEQASGTPHAMIMGSFNSIGDYFWSKSSESFFQLDYEHIGYGPIVSDLCLFFSQVLEDHRKAFQDASLKAYHDKLTELGKIDTSVYTLEKLTNDYKKYFLPASISFLAKTNLKGHKDAMMMMVGNVMGVVKDAGVNAENILPPLFTGIQFIERSKADHFDIEMETGPDGKQRVKVFHQMPFSVDQSTSDSDLIFRLLAANGMDIKEFEFSGVLSGGLSQEVKLGTCHMNDGSKVEVVIKVNKEISNGVPNQWKEALFFAEYYPAKGMEEFRANYCMPKIFLVMVDKEINRQIMIMEYLAGDDNISYEKLMGYQNGSYVHAGVNFECDKKPIEETAGPGVTYHDVLFSIAENLAALHYYSWNDKSNFEKYPYFGKSDLYQGLGEDKYNQTMTTLNQQMDMFVKPESKLVQEYPEVAKILKACHEKAKDFKTFQKVYVDDPKMHFSIVHGDSHDRQCVWSKTKKSAVIFDYELMGFGPAVTDICYLYAMLQMNNDFDEEELLKVYHKKLTSFGDKVTAESYPYEQLHKDFVRFFFPKNAFLVAMVCGMMVGKGADAIGAAHDRFIKKHGITEENVEPMFLFI